MSAGRAAATLAVAGLLGLAGCGAGDPPPPRTVGSATVGVTATRPDRVLSSEARRLDGRDVERYFAIRLPRGAEAPVAVRDGFMDDRVVARLTIPGAAVDAFVRRNGLDAEDRCAGFDAVTVGGLRVGPVPASRVRCSETDRPPRPGLAYRRTGLVPAGDRVEVLLYGFTT